MTIATGLAALVLGSISVAGAFGALYAIQPSLLFYPDRTPPDFVYQTESAAEEVWLSTAVGRIHGLFLSPRSSPEPRTSAGIIVYFHGNAGDLKSWSLVGDQLVSRTSWSVLMIDYPTFGKSEGRLRSDDDLVLPAQAAVDWTLARVEERHLVIYGRSIGTGVAAAAALHAKGRASGVVLESPYINLRTLVSEKAPWAPRFIHRFHLPLDEWLRNTREISADGLELLLVHGAQDDLIPASHSQRLQTAIDPERKWSRAVLVPEAGHNDLGLFSEYWTELEAFLAKIRARELPDRPSKAGI